MSQTMIEQVVEAIRAGRPVLLPTDTVYGLCVSPYRAEHTQRLYGLKGRDASQPTALVARDVETLLECVPELRGRNGMIARALLPGQYTLVFPNPARRYPWLTGSRPDTIGVRVPELTGDVREVFERVLAVAATSANLPGGPEPARLEEVPHELRAACAAELDAGTLPGVSSTVLDFTGPEPAVLRDGAAAASEALAKVAGLS